MISRIAPALLASLSGLVLLVAPAAGLRPFRRCGPTPQAAPSTWPLVAWTPIPENPVFAGTGRDTWDRKIRERGYILVSDDGTYHLWYTGYAGDRPADDVAGPCHLARRHPLDPRSRQPDLHRLVGRRYVRRPPRRHLLHVRRGKERHRPPA